MTLPEIYPVGDDALAVRASDRDVRHQLAAALRGSGLWWDVVPGKREVTVHFDPMLISPDQARERLAHLVTETSAAAGAAARTVTLTMMSDAAAAPDLARIAGQNGLSPGALLARIAASDLMVDMMGFTAGFAYVSGVDPALVSPRLDVPRQRVPAGSVGFISGQIGLYALAGPGGWPLIGRVAQPLFDMSRPEPFLLDAGAKIRLVVER